MVPQWSVSMQVVGIATSIPLDLNRYQPSGIPLSQSRREVFEAVNFVLRWGSSNTLALWHTFCEGNGHGAADAIGVVISTQTKEGN